MHNTFTNDNQHIQVYEVGMSGLHAIIHPLTNCTPLGNALLNDFNFNNGRCFALLPAGLNSNDLSRVIDNRFTTWPLTSGSSAVRQEMPRTDIIMAEIAFGVLRKKDCYVLMVEDFVLKKSDFLSKMRKKDTLRTSDTLGSKLMLKVSDTWLDNWFYREWIYSFLCSNKKDISSKDIFDFYNTTFFFDENVTMITEMAGPLPSGQELNGSNLAQLARDCCFMFVPCLSQSSYVFWIRNDLQIDFLKDLLISETLVHGR